ncbi:MAG: fatty acid desaturase [Myxococcota bacterium]
MAMTTPDPRWIRPTNPGWVDRVAWQVVRDERDTLFVKVLGLASLLLIPSAIGLFLAPTWLTLALAVPYLYLVYGGFGGRYMLLVHALCHRPAFNKGWEWLFPYTTWVLGPLFGSTPTSFFAHHMGMHHPENNLESDLSTTLPYQRDRFGHFVHYWARFFVFGLIHLVRYFRLRHRDKLLRSLMIGEVAWFSAVALGLWVDWAATLVVLIVPYCLIRWFMMCGNFAQHAFVDVDDPGNAYRNSTCLTNTRYNHKCYNDGYHIVHHLKPALHWTEMATWYEERVDEFARQDAVVFSGIRNNQQVWVLLMTGRYDVLAAHLVDFHGRSLDERIAFLKDRVRRRRGEPRGFLELEQPLAA